MRGGGGCAVPARHEALPTPSTVPPRRCWAHRRCRRCARRRDDTRPSRVGRALRLRAHAAPSRDALVSGAARAAASAALAATGGAAVCAAACADAPVRAPRRGWSGARRQRSFACVPTGRRSDAMKRSPSAGLELVSPGSKERPGRRAPRRGARCITAVLTRNCISQRCAAGRARRVRGAYQRMRPGCTPPAAGRRRRRPVREAPRRRVVMVRPAPRQHRPCCSARQPPPLHAPPRHTPPPRVG